MRAVLASYNIELKRRELPELSVGISLHCGTGVVGLMRSTKLKEFAFAGRGVNVAARVQTLTRQFEVDVILTEVLKQTIDLRFEMTALPGIVVKGVRQAFAIHVLQ